MKDLGYISSQQIPKHISANDYLQIHEGKTLLFEVKNIFEPLPVPGPLPALEVQAAALPKGISLTAYRHHSADVKFAVETMAEEMQGLGQKTLSIGITAHSPQKIKELSRKYILQALHHALEPKLIINGKTLNEEELRQAIAEAQKESSTRFSLIRSCFPFFSCVRSVSQEPEVHSKNVLITAVN